MVENEAILLKRFSTGADAEAFAELVRRYVQLVYSTSWRVLKDDSDATDVTQETFFELTRHASRISGSLASWLHRVAMLKSIDVVRRTASRRHREQAYARTHPVEVQTWQDLSDHVDEALDRLDESLKSLLLEHFVTGKTTAQIAREQGISQATVSRRVNAGLSQLRGMLRRKGLLVTAAALATMLMENTSQAVSAAVLGGLGKMAMVGTTGSAAGLGGAASLAAKAGMVKAMLATATVIGAVSVAGYVQHCRTSRALPPLPLPVQTGSQASNQGAGAPSPDSAGMAMTVASEPPMAAVGPELPEAAQSRTEEPGPGAFAALPGPVEQSDASDMSGPEPATSVRVLHFPRDESVGVVYVQDEDVVIPNTLAGFQRGRAYAERENFCPARDVVRIPAGKRAILCLRGAGATPERCRRALESLAPDDLYGLQFFSWPPIHVDDDLIESITRLTGLRELGLAGTRVNPRRLSLLAALVHMEQLSTPWGLSDAGMGKIAEMPSVKRLYVGPDEMTDEGLRSLGKLASLEVLELCGNPRMTDDGLRALVPLRSLRCLRLGMQGPFTDRGMGHVAMLPALNMLWLDTPNITDEGLRRLTRSRSLERLCVRWLDKITDRGIGYLKAMPQLKKLDVGRARLTDAGLAHFAAMANLNDLRLPSGLTDAGISRLGDMGDLKCLRVNCTGNSPLTDATLTTIGNLRGLEELHIGGTGFTYQGIQSLRRLEHLEVLFLMSPALNDDTLEQLARLPNLRVLSWACCGDVTMSGLNALNELAHLESLCADDVRQDDAGLDISGLKKLRCLRISMRRQTARIGDEYVTTYDACHDSDLACLSGLTNLEDFGLDGRGIGDAGLAHLAPLTHLKHLQITGSADLTDAGLAHLADLRRLDSLYIHNSRITERGLAHLHSSKTLRILSIKSAATIDGQAVARLRSELPRLQRLDISSPEPTRRPVTLKPAVRERAHPARSSSKRPRNGRRRRPYYYDTPRYSRADRSPDRGQ